MFQSMVIYTPRGLSTIGREVQEPSPMKGEKCMNSGNNTTQESKYTKEEYNSIPVYYCKHCGSLKVMAMPPSDYCDTCGSTDIGKANIEIWLELQKTVFKPVADDRPKRKLNIFK